MILTGADSTGDPCSGFRRGFGPQSRSCGLNSREPPANAGNPDRVEPGLLPTKGPANHKCTGGMVARIAPRRSPVRVRLAPFQGVPARGRLLLTTNRPRSPRIALQIPLDSGDSGSLVCRRREYGSSASGGSGAGGVGRPGPGRRPVAGGVCPRRPTGRKPAISFTAWQDSSSRGGREDGRRDRGQPRSACVEMHESEAGTGYPACRAKLARAERMRDPRRRLLDDHAGAASCASSVATAEAPAPTSQLSGALGR
jgi:hypothetical protein